MFLSFLALGCAKKEARLLRYAFSTEGAQRYRTTLTMSSSTGSLTQILIEETHRFEGLLPSGTASMEVHFDTVEVHLTDPQSLAPSILARSLQGKTLRLSVSPRGEVRGVEGEEGLGVQGSGGMNLNQTFSQIFPPLPEDVVRPGDSWTSREEASVPSPKMEITNRVRTTYTLLGFEISEGKKDLAQVKIKTTSELSGKPRDPGTSEKLQGRMSGEGVYSLDLKEGRLRTLEMKNKTEVTSENGGITTKLKTDQTVKVEALN